MSETTRLERSSHVVPGDRSELRLEDGHITLTKEAGTQARPTSVTVPIEQVRSVTLNSPSRGRPGWLHLAVVNGSPTPPSELAAMGDPYTLPLTTRHLHAARRLEKMVDDHVRRRGLPHVESGTAAGTGSGVILNPAPPAPPPPTPPPAPPDDSPSAAAATDPADAPSSPDAPPAAASAAGPGEASGEVVPRGELAGHLRELAELHEAGALSDREFEQAKRRVLGD